MIIGLYAVLGGMKGISWTQVAQYTVLITAYLIPAVAVAQQRCNATGAAAGMIIGMLFTATYMIYTLQVFGTEANPHILDISPEGIGTIGTIGAIVNFIVTIVA